MPFAVRMVWREPNNLLTIAIFAWQKLKVIPKKRKRKIEYPNLLFAIRPVPHNADLPVQTAPLDWQDIVIGDNRDINALSGSSEEQCTDYTFITGPTYGKPHLIVQSEWN